MTRGGEGNLPLAFRLPAVEDYELAVEHGFGVVEPFLDAVLWWSSSTTTLGEAWVLSDNKRKPFNPNAVDEYYRFRCIATPEHR